MIEAAIAIMAILSALLLISLQGGATRDTDLIEKMPVILDELVKNASLRENVAKDYNLFQDQDNEIIDSKIREFLSDRIENPDIEYDFEICRAEELCALTEFPTDSGAEIYSYERIVSSIETSPVFDPRKIKLYVWRKN